MNAPNDRPPSVGVIAYRWWRGLQDETGDGKSKPGNATALAKLRRATFVAAMAQEETIDLFERLGFRNARRLPRVATLACLLAHVREDAANTLFARSIGRQSFSDKDSAALKPLRFQRLIDAQDEEEILRAFRRAIEIVDRRVNVADLARILLYFDDEQTRQKLTFDYYGAGLARPSAEPASA